MSYQTINPTNEEKVKVFPEHTDEQLEELIARAQSTYQNDWSRRTLAERKAVLKNAASILRKERSDFARLLTLEMGKLLQEAGGEVDLSADILDYYADNAEKFLAPKQLKVDEGEAIVENAPLGVIFCVEPWNFPYYQLARVAGPNLMLGNTLVRVSPTKVRKVPQDSCQLPGRKGFRRFRNSQDETCFSRSVLGA
jgi:succinate-semialdehyde dehydrogenase/glutarate-semialdehyde dehydrogenase